MSQFIQDGELRIDRTLSADAGGTTSRSSTWRRSSWPRAGLLEPQVWSGRLQKLVGTRQPMRRLWIRTASRPWSSSDRTRYGHDLFGITVVLLEVVVADGPVN